MEIETFARLSAVLAAVLAASWLAARRFIRPVCHGEYFHDWEEVKAWSEYRCLQEAQRAVDGREPRGPDLVTSQAMTVRVCLRCGRIEDMITPTVERLEREIRNKRSRAERAQEIYKEASCAEDKCE